MTEDLDQDGLPRLPALTGPAVAESLPGLARVAGSAALHTAGWGLRTTTRNWMRVGRAVTSRDEAASLIRDVGSYVGALGESAIQQGYGAGTLSLSQTNSTFSKGQAPANQVYIATHAGFLLSKISSDDLTATPTETLLQMSTIAAAAANKSDVFAVGQNFSWDLTIGRGITRTIGLLSEYTLSQAYATTDEGLAAATAIDTISGQNGSPAVGITKLQVPVVFPPLVNVTITATNGSPFTLLSTAAADQFLQFKMVMRGYLMTMPVG